MTRLRGFGLERGRAKKPVRLGAGTGVPCPYNGKMRPSAWARLSDAPTSTPYNFAALVVRTMRKRALPCIIRA